MNLNLKIKTKIFWDNRAKCWIVYSKKFEVSAYGKSKPKAIKMFKEIIYGILEYTK